VGSGESDARGSSAVWHATRGPWRAAAGSGAVAHGGLVWEEGGRMSHPGKEGNGLGPRERYFFYLIDFFKKT
jgi:hypothetical protein